MFPKFPSDFSKIGYVGDVKAYLRFYELNDIYSRAKSNQKQKDHIKFDAKKYLKLF